MATRILTEFLAEMKEVLKVKKTVVFPGLGRLRATRENHFFFVADEDLDIYPEGLGLAPLSLKTHVETPEEVATAVAGLAELIEEIPGQAGNDEEEAGNDDKEAEPMPEPEEKPEPELTPAPVPVQETEAEPEPELIPEPEMVPEEEKVEEIPGQAGNDEEEAQNDEKEARNIEDKQEPVEEPEPKKSHRKFWRIVLIVLGVLVALLLVFVLLSRIAPGLLDPLLYSKEELQILRYQ